MRGAVCGAVCVGLCICCAHPHVDPSQSRHPRAVRSLLLPPQKPLLASPFWKHRSSSGEWLCTVPTPRASPNPLSPCRCGAVSNVLMSLPLCCWDFCFKKSKGENSLVGWERSLGAVSGNGNACSLYQVSGIASPAVCYLPNCGSIRAPSLIYCPRSPGYVAELQ